MEELESEEECTFYEPIKKNRMDFFQKEPTSGDPKQKVLDEDCHLFAKLFISCQSRVCDLQEFFWHENQSFPAALSDIAKIQTCQKSQLTAILNPHVTLPDTGPEADVIIVDSSILMNSATTKLKVI